MQIKSIVAGAAIALAAAVGSASAADQFSTLKGISADVLTAQEMGVVMGAFVGAALSVAIPGTGPDAQAPVTSSLKFSDGANAGLIESFGADTENDLGAALIRISP